MANHRTPLSIAVATGRVQRDPKRYADRVSSDDEPPLPEVPPAPLSVDEMAVYTQQRQIRWWLTAADAHLLAAYCRIVVRTAQPNAEASWFNTLARYDKQLGRPVNGLPAPSDPDDDV